MKTTWTQRDEAELKALQDRKDTVMAARRAAVEKLVDAFDSPAWQCVYASEVTAWLIKNADAIRDALEPFDSGARPA